MVDTVVPRPNVSLLRLVLERRGQVSMRWWWSVASQGRALAQSNRSYVTIDDALEAGRPELERLKTEAAPPLVADRVDKE